MLRKDKKGWIRIAEAFIAVTLIASVLVVLYVRTVQIPQEREEVYNLQKTILDEIASSPELRNYILVNDSEKMNSFVKERVPVAFNFSVRICQTNDICGLQFYEKDIYSSERIISANLTSYEPKKIKIFMWRD
jgi:Ni,Fe-hydrogenase I cytochrome b subunit